MQLVDELSMIYTTCLMCYATFSHGNSRKFSVVLGICLAGLAAFITLYYHYLQDPTFHQNAYALLTVIVLLRSMFVMEINIRPSMRRNVKAHQRLRDPKPISLSQETKQDIEDRRDEKIVKEMWILIATGLSVFLGGFGVWTLDNVYCSNLRRWRRQIGLPWGILLEGHGWW
jgi:dihydroceramidase